MSGPSAARPLRVRVPASTSNLGPGFDLLGLAVSLFLEVELHPIAGEEHTVTRSGPFRGELDGIESDLCAVAFARAAEALGVPGAYRFEVRSEVPVGRGIGSSGAAVAAGLLLAATLAPRPVSAGELHGLGVALEGHPDNVTASLFGGCTLCHPDPLGNGPLWFHQPLHPSLTIALAWPAEALPTARARAVLAERVPRRDAVENARRLALLLEGLRTARPELLRAGGEDRLHVARRLPLIPGAAEALAAGRAAGAEVATLSGAGSGLVALCVQASAGEVAAAMADAFRTVTGQGTGRVVEPVFGAPRVRSVDTG